MAYGTPEITRTFAGTTDRDKWTLSSGWFKRGNLSARTLYAFMLQVMEVQPTIQKLEFGSRWATLTLDYDKPLYGTGWCTMVTNRLFRDPAAWYHLVLYLGYWKCLVPGDRMRYLWINGVRRNKLLDYGNIIQVHKMKLVVLLHKVVLNLHDIGKQTR